MHDSLDCFRHGALALTRRQFDEAERWARVGLAVDEDDGQLWQLLGVALWSRGERDPAREALESASVLVPLCPLATCALADCYYRLGKVEPARACLMHLARPGRCPVELLPRVASGLGAIGEDAVALEVCRRIVDHDPAHHSAHFGIAYYLARLDGPAEDVIESLRRAHSLAPDRLPYRLNLAWALACVGKWGESAELLAELSAGTVRCPFWLARMETVFVSAGDRERASICRAQLTVLLSFA
jgi:tetratricopeptide (TPR) repeat protein